MPTITKTTNQLPGILEIIAIPVTAISEINDNDIIVPNPSNIFRFKPSADSGEYRMDHRNSENGDYFRHFVTTYIQGYTPEKNKDFAEAVSHEHVLIIQNEDGTWKRLGSPDYPFQFTIGFQTQGPGYNLRFTADTLIPEYPNPLINSLPITTPISTSS